MNHCKCLANKDNWIPEKISSVGNLAVPAGAVIAKRVDGLAYDCSRLVTSVSIKNHGTNSVIYVLNQDNEVLEVLREMESFQYSVGDTNRFIFQKFKLFFYELDQRCDNSAELVHEHLYNVRESMALVGKCTCI
jgi:hypothetical protein